jgi:aarF domain-containing kinase
VAGARSAPTRKAEAEPQGLPTSPVVVPDVVVVVPPAPPAASRAERATQGVAAAALTMPAAAAAAATPAAAVGAPPPLVRRQRVFREVAVPASPLARVWGFGTLAAGMAFGAAGEALGLGGGAARRRAAESAEVSAAAAGGEAPSSSSSSPTSSSTATSKPSSSAQQHIPLPPAIRISEAQAERLAEGLCRMRGAALKIGQMLSLSDESLLPPEIARILERVRTQADIMPRRQLERVLAAELGDDWRARLGGDAFSEQPVAAASIGQVHRTVLPDGRSAAVKVQYPGVAESINSDLNNLRRLLAVANFLPKGLYIDPLIDVAREELTNECDYVREAEAQRRFRALVADDPDFEVPDVVAEASTRRILTTTWLRGMPIDAVVELNYPQEVRDMIARKLLKLTLKELFVWRYMQTDPNWGNFFYDPDRKVIGLLDFGAAREFSKPFVDDYLRLVWAAANKDRDTIAELSIKLGFLTGYESKVMLDAHIDSGLVVGEPFASHAPFDFRGSGITARVGKHGAVFAEHRLTAPPPEVYSLHRKLAGAFLICIRMGAVMPCRDLLEETFEKHKWG